MLYQLGSRRAETVVENCCLGYNINDSVLIALPVQGPSTERERGAVALQQIEIGARLSRPDLHAFRRNRRPKTATFPSAVQVVVMSVPHIVSIVR